MCSLKKVLIYLFLACMTIVFIFPFVWMLISATNSSSDIIQGTISPGGELINNLKTLVIGTNFKTGYINTIFLTIVGVSLTLFLTSITAYCFQFLGNKYTEKVYLLMILSMMVPFAALMVPLFKIISTMGLVNTFWAVILQGVASIFLLFFFRQSIKNFPIELIEAARMDGLNEFKIFIKIFTPSLKSTYVAAAIISFLSYWNNYLWPIMVLQDNDKQTLTMFISALGSSNTPDNGAILLAVILSSIPSIIIFFALQKYFVEGMVGSGK